MSESEILESSNKRSYLKCASRARRGCYMSLSTFFHKILSTLLEINGEETMVYSAHGSKAKHEND